MKRILYWLTVIPPLVEWIQKIIKEANDEKLTEKNKKQSEAFEKANRGESGN